ncbi:hypothetical protein [Novipirellula galeiformis]|uniref:hypothetical protein n=1 Tax=Novipirellula galeiformis TaxID=2528004 RepID=UPI0011B792EC|nr:hypothetical protein [Novipirellula galeiformis]
MFLQLETLLAVPGHGERSATRLMFIDPAYNAIAFIVAFGTLPFVIAGIALQLHRKNTRHVFAKPLLLFGAAVGVPAAVAILRAINVSKYPETDFVFGVVFVIWLASLGGLAGAILDRLRFGRGSPSQSDVM